MNELLNILYYFAQLITLMLPNMALLYFYMYKEWKLTHISQQNEMCNTTLNYYTSKSEEWKIVYTYKAEYDFSTSKCAFDLVHFCMHLSIYLYILHWAMYLI